MVDYLYKLLPLHSSSLCFKSELQLLQLLLELPLTDEMKDKVTTILAMDPKNMTKTEKEVACAAILINAMYGLGMKPKDYPVFFEAAIKKVGVTNMLEATN